MEAIGQPCVTSKVVESVEDAHGICQGDRAIL